MIITLDGTPGSGKNTIGERLAEEYHLQFYSVGDTMIRAVAKKRGITIKELLVLREKDPTIDQEADTYQENLGKEEDNFVITGRTSYHFIPHAIKIFLKVSYTVAAKRIWKDVQASDKRNEGKYSSESQVAQFTKERNERDWQIYKKYYDIDVNNAFNYDLVVDTSILSKDEVFHVVKTFIDQIHKHHADKHVPDSHSPDKHEDKSRT
jgi:predicted cytidylate kinase